jgi:hypothetical protein
MTIIGFNFTKMHIERKKMVRGSINISNNISIKNLEKADITLGQKKQALKYDFTFTTQYKPDIGEILLEGEVIALETEEKAQELLKIWKKDKKLPNQMMTSILNHVLNKCNIQALFMSKELNLPAPIPLPKVQQK